MLKTIADAGYAGVELAQHPEEFGSAELLYKSLRDNKLKLLGLAGGAVEDRVAFVEKLADAQNIDLAKQPGKPNKVIGFAPEYPYVYIDAWDDGHGISSVGRRWKFALHSHMFKPIQTAKEALRVLRERPELRFLPDTAHLTVAGDDVIMVLKESFEIPVLDEQTASRVTRRFGPVIAVHLKDWTSEFGRSYQFYSRGFGVRFGQGEVNLDRVVKFLREEGYDGWVVVEQDVVDDTVGAIRACRQWLRERGI